MKEIREWLASGQDYAQGVALYETHCKSRVVLTALRRGASEFTRQKLREELTKLSQAVTPSALVPVVANAPKPAVKAPARVGGQATDKTDKTDKKPDKPDTEVVRVSEAVRAQRSSWYAERHRLHATLELLATDEERRVAGERILTISELLTASYHAAPDAPRCPRPNLAAVTDEGEIRRLLANLRPQRTKLTKNPARALDLQQVRADIKLLERKLKP